MKTTAIWLLVWFVICYWMTVYVYTQYDGPAKWMFFYLWIFYTLITLIFTIITGVAYYIDKTKNEK